MDNMEREYFYIWTWETYGAFGACMMEIYGNDGGRILDVFSEIGLGRLRIGKAILVKHDGTKSQCWKVGNHPRQCSYLFEMRSFSIFSLEGCGRFLNTCHQIVPKQFSFIFS